MPCTDDCPDLLGLKRRCHCGSCHRTFSGVWAFDEHRLDGRCVVIGRLKEIDGIWRSNAKNTFRA